MSAALVRGFVIVLALAWPVPHAVAQAPRDYYQVLATEPGILQIMQDLHIRLGEQSLRARHYGGTFREAQFVLNLFPNHPRALTLMAQACEQGRLATCALDEVFRKAIVINPKAAATYSIQGIFLQWQRRYADAIRSFNQALELDPDSMNAHYNLALAYIETKDYARANEHAQRAYALGAPLPGLKNRLQRLGYWTPAPAAPPAAAAEPAASEPPAAAPAPRAPTEDADPSTNK